MESAGKSAPQTRWHHNLGDSLTIVGLAVAVLTWAFAPNFYAKSVAVFIGMGLLIYLSYKSHFVRNWPDFCKHIGAILAFAVVLAAALLQLIPQWGEEHPKHQYTQTLPPSLEGQQKNQEATNPAARLTNAELRHAVKELSDNMRDFETDARQKTDALMSQPRFFVNGKPIDEVSWKRRVKQNAMFHAAEQTDFRKRYLPDAEAYKDEMLRRLNETRPNRETELVALQGDLEGTSPISDLADYLEWLSRRLPQ
jgi:hypothetical protein